MYHGMTFKVGDNTYDTWETWHLIPTSRPVVNPPKVKRNLIALPGTNSFIDMGKYPNNITTYENRTGSWEFAVDNRKKDTWDHIYHDILKRIHGLYVDQIILDDELPFYYQGYLDVNVWKSDKYYSTITIDYDLYPYKRRVRSSVEAWLWDPFDFVYSEIDAQEEKNATALDHVSFNKPLGSDHNVSLAYSIECPISDEPVVPNIIVHSGTEIYYVYDAFDTDYTGTVYGHDPVLQKLKYGDNKSLFHCIIPSARDINNERVTNAYLHLFGSNAVVSIVYHRGYL